MPADEMSLMTDSTTATTTRWLREGDALPLAELMAAYATETRLGPPRVADRLYAERLIAEAGVAFLGAFAGDRLVGYAAVLDLPVVPTGRRRGQVEDIYIDVRQRQGGHARALIEALEREGEARGWTDLRWTVPYRSDGGEAFSKALGQPARERQFVITFAEEMLRDN